MFNHLKRMVAVFFTPEILLMVAKVYVPVLFPLTFLIALLAMRMDHWLGMGTGFLPAPLNLFLAVFFFALGTVIWLTAYSAIVFEGKGSPSPTAGRTQKLVTTGLYAFCRYPSIYGKLLGVLAIGLAMNSVSFCFVLVPLLLAGSLVEKKWRQDKQNREIFGEAYEEYSRNVPFFIPWKLFLPRHSGRESE